MLCSSSISLRKVLIITFTTISTVQCLVTIVLLFQPGITDNSQVKSPMPFSVILGSFYAFLFLCTIPLYIHIYIVVKNSSTQMNVKREGVLARKVAVLVFTNLIFSPIPLSLKPIVSSQDAMTLDLFKPFLTTYSSFQAFIIFFVWLPVLLLCLNSCFKPLLRFPL